MYRILHILSIHKHSIFLRARTKQNKCSSLIVGPLKKSKKAFLKHSILCFHAMTSQLSNEICWKILPWRCSCVYILWPWPARGGKSKWSYEGRQRTYKSSFLMILYSFVVRGCRRAILMRDLWMQHIQECATYSTYSMHAMHSNRCNSTTMILHFPTQGIGIFITYIWICFQHNPS